MDLVLDLEGQRQLTDYFAGIGRILGDPRRQASFATYAFGLLGDGERKSMEPIAARSCPDQDRLDAAHQRLQHFLVDSKWSDRGVRRYAARYVVDALITREPIDAWIVDDTGFLKQGKHSVGVQRQYTGTAGKVTNCQIGVSLAVATRTEHVPIDFELYLPKCWTDDGARRREARIPDAIAFKTKPALALDQIDRALADGIPRGVVLVDSAYGNSSEFRDQLRQRGLDYAAAIDGTTKVWRIDASSDARRGAALSVRDLALQIAKKKRGFRRVTWRHGIKNKLSARFAIRRVLPFHDDGWDAATERERLWLVCEWPHDEKEPTKYYLVTLPKGWTNKRLIRLIKQRWRTERAYEDLKGELGLDHFEGRRFPGWHHHVSVALCCYAFVVAERVRRFPPSARRQEGDGPIAIAA
jgi:SRSO17 transposase